MTIKDFADKLNVQYHKNDTTRFSTRKLDDNTEYLIVYKTEDDVLDDYFSSNDGFPKGNVSYSAKNEMVATFHKDGNWNLETGISDCLPLEVKQIVIWALISNHRNWLDEY